MPKKCFRNMISYRYLIPKIKAVSWIFLKDWTNNSSHCILFSSSSISIQKIAWTSTFFSNQYLNLRNKLIRTKDFSKIVYIYEEFNKMLTLNFMKRGILCRFDKYCFETFFIVTVITLWSIICNFGSFTSVEFKGEGIVKIIISVPATLIIFKCTAWQTNI